MQVIILTAGRGTRMGELTETTQKTMLTVQGKNLLDWKIDALPEEVDEIIFVIGYLGSQIQKHFGNEYTRNNKTYHITYVEQKELNGTGGSLVLCKEQLGDRLQERFMVLMGDDIYVKEDLERLIQEDLAVLVSETKKHGGLFLVNDEGDVVGLEEGLVTIQEDTVGFKKYMNTGAYILNEDIFAYPLVKVSQKEYGLPHTLVQESYLATHTLKAIPATDWIQITDPQSLITAENLLSAI